MAKAKATSSNNNPENPIEILKADTCPTSSGKSILSYHIGSAPEGQAYLKVAGNDGGGMFSPEWVSFQDIQNAIAEWPEDQGITSMTFRKIFRGKSANTPGFLVAVLCAEGIIEPIGDKKRVHQACDPSTFLASVEALQGGSSKKPKAQAKAKAAPKAKTKSPRKSTANTSGTRSSKTPRKPPARSKKAS